MSIDFDKLMAMFPYDELDWRVMKTGRGNNGPWVRVFCYLNNRAIMDRLDQVCGPAHWHNQFIPWGDGAQLCGISIEVDDGKWVTKWDGAENTDRDAVKGGLTSSMRRAAVQWGVGRYLYSIGDTYGVVKSDGKYWCKADDGSSIKWDPPQLPARFRPVGDNGGRASPEPRKPVAPSPEASFMEINKKFDLAMATVRTATRDSILVACEKRMAEIPFSHLHKTTLETAIREKREEITQTGGTQ